MIQSFTRYYQFLVNSFLQEYCGEDIIATDPLTKEVDWPRAGDADGLPASFPQRPAINSTKGAGCRAGSISIEASSVVEVLSNYRSYRRYENRSAVGSFAHYTAPYHGDGYIYCVPGVPNDRQVEPRNRETTMEVRTA